MNEEVVFISGASRGIGTAIAENFAKLGHKVIGTSRSQFHFENKLDNLIPIALDIADRDSINQCIEFLKDNNFKPSISLIMQVLHLINFS
jgi:NADP-dependent 3-hydroxy acid dehydrogenase YdfG